MTRGERTTAVIGLASLITGIAIIGSGPPAPSAVAAQPAIEARVAELEAQVAELEARVLALEGGVPSTPSPTPAPTPSPTLSVAPSATTSPQPSATSRPSSSPSSTTPTTTPSANASPTPSATPSPTAPPSPPAPGSFIGPDPNGPTSGSAWTYLRDQANGSWGSPALTTDQDNRHNVKVLAGALYAARTGDAAMRTKVRDALMAVVAAGLPKAENAILSMGRQLGAYVMAADYIDLSGPDDTAFRAFLARTRIEAAGTHGRYKSLRQTAEDSPHNWGTFALASLIAVDRYLGDAQAVARDWQVYQGYVDRAAFAGFEQISNSWACPGVPFTPANGGCPSDALRYGAWPKDLIRGGDYPTLGSTGTSYSREIIQGVVVSAELLERAGYPAWAKLRPAWDWADDHAIYNNHQTGYYTTWMVEANTDLDLENRPAGYGRLFGYTDWLYGGAP